MKLSIKDVVNATRGKLMSGNSDQMIKGISTDTRSLEKGDLFVALRGEHHDGHDHVAQALEKGAVGVLTDRPVSSILEDATVILTKDSLKGLGLIAKFWRDQFDMPVIAVTGSNGKTTTKDMIAAILESRFRVLKTEGNFNNWIGLPQTLFRLDKNCQKIILEMGMNHKGEIDWLSRIASPEVGVITHIGRAHIENFKNQYGIACAKGELLAHLPKKGLAVLNADDFYFEALKRKTSSRVVSFGFSKKATARLISVNSSMEGTCFQVFIEGKKRIFEIPLGGAHNASNALAAILVGRHYGVSFEKIRTSLKKYRPEKKRMEIFHLGRRVDVINDSYNANPDSVTAAIDYLESFSDRHRILVLGDMFELGAQSDSYHYEIGKRVALSGIDKLFAIGKHSAKTVEGALDAGMEHSCVRYAKDVESILSDFCRHIEDGDLVLIKGSRGMKMERLTEKLIKERSH